MSTSIRTTTIDFLQTTSFMLRGVMQAVDKLNEARGGKALLTAQGETAHALKVAAHIEEMERTVTALEGALFEKTKKLCLESVETLLKDINECLKQADDANDTWRKQVTNLAIRTRQGVVTPELRESLEAGIAESKAAYDAALAVAADLVPAQTGIILL